MTSRSKRWALVGAGLGVAASISAAAIFFELPMSATATAASEPAQPPAVPVTVAVVASRDVTNWENFSGRLEAIDRVQIRPRVGGAIQSVHFREGALVKQGDLLITRAGPRSRCGVCSYVSTTRPRLMVCDKAYRFRAQRTVAEGHYVGFALNAPALLQAIESIKTGGSESGLNLTQTRFRQLLVPLPPLREQRRIIAKVVELFDVIEILEGRLRRVEALRPKVLQLGVQGMLVEPDASDEPASALLERIARERESLTDAKPRKQSRPSASKLLTDVPYELPSGWVWARLGDVADYRTAETALSGRLPGYRTDLCGSR